MSCSRKDPLALSLGGRSEGVLWLMPEASVLIVESDPGRVEADLVAGSVTCPLCEGVLRRWGFARWRTLRGRHGPVGLRPRRARCRSCGSTHVLLPDGLLVRRVDTAEVIGAALAYAATSGVGHRRVAEYVDRPLSTVGDWLRRFRAVVIRVAAHFAIWAVHLDPMLGPILPAGSILADAVEAVGVAARAASLRLGSRPVWSWASVLTAGRLLFNTNSNWLAP